MAYGNDAAPLLLNAGRQLEPFDLELARSEAGLADDPAVVCILTEIARLFDVLADRLATDQPDDPEVASY